MIEGPKTIQRHRLTQNYKINRNEPNEGNQTKKCKHYIQNDETSKSSATHSSYIHCTDILYPWI